MVTASKDLGDLEKPICNSLHLDSCDDHCLAALFGSVNFIANLYLFSSVMAIYQLPSLSEDTRRVRPQFREKRAGR